MNNIQNTKGPKDQTLRMHWSTKKLSFLCNIFAFNYKKISSFTNTKLEAELNILQ